jgi:hypothetical protein
VAAAARRGHVRVVDREPTLEAVEEIDLRSLQIGRAEGVDHDRHAERIDLVVALLGSRIEPQRVLEARATTALDRDAEDRGLAFRLLGHQLLHLRRSALGQHDQSFSFDRRHRSHGSNAPRSLNPLRPKFVTPDTRMAERNPRLLVRW